MIKPNHTLALNAKNIVRIKIFNNVAGPTLKNIPKTDGCGIKPVKPKPEDCHQPKPNNPGGCNDPKPAKPDKCGKPTVVKTTDC